jgi:hypothetical protein
VENITNRKSENYKLCKNITTSGIQKQYCREKDLSHSKQMTELKFGYRVAAGLWKNKFTLRLGSLHNMGFF